MSKTIKVAGFIPVFVSYDAWTSHHDFPLTKVDLTLLSANSWKSDNSKTVANVKVTGSYEDNGVTKEISFQISVGTLFGFTTKKFLQFDEETNETEIPASIMLAKKKSNLEVKQVLTETKVK